MIGVGPKVYVVKQKVGGHRADVFMALYLASNDKNLRSRTIAYSVFSPLSGGNNRSCGILSGTQEYFGLVSKSCIV